MFTSIANILSTLGLESKSAFNEQLAVNQAVELVREENARYLVEMELLEDDYRANEIAYYKSIS